MAGLVKSLDSENAVAGQILVVKFWVLAWPAVWTT